MFFNFSVRNIDFSPWADGVRIRVITADGCHLYLRLSSTEPLIHKKSSLRRGIAFAEDVRFCFTVFEDNEQLEDGDTQVHTWLKTGWPFCTTKYLYFWGYRMGTVCVSTTAPFSYHNKGWKWELLFTEPWHYHFPPPPDSLLLFREYWTYWPPAPPGFLILFVEPWTYYTPPMVLLFSEPWTE